MNRFLRPPDRILNSLTGSEKIIYDYLEQNLANIPTSSISEISNSTYSSPSAVFNVLKKLGYSGYKEFKFECQIYVKDLSRVVSGDTFVENRYNLITSKASIIETIENQKFEDIKELCVKINSSKRILVIANEITKYVVKDFSYRLQNLGVDITNSFDHKQYEVLLTHDMYDFIIVFSKFGNTEKIIRAIEKTGRKINLLITSNHKGYLLNYSQSVLFGTYSGVSISNTTDTVGDVNSRVELYIISDMIINTYIYKYFYEKEKDEKI
ncbi:MAG: MurR/RpiR family transcriptional regulator [Mycoplasmatales bacterium]